MSHSKPLVNIFNHLINCGDFTECLQLYGIEFGYDGYINDW